MIGIIYTAAALGIALAVWLVPAYRSRRAGGAR